MDTRISIIINTYNRVTHLKRLIDSLSKQTYENFEVVVVNGPSTDDTESVLDKYKTVLKIEKCPIINLCVSRNIGIRASSGDIVAFIDDDAVPTNKYWIENLVSYYKNDKVGGVGGKVFRMNYDVEFANGYIDIWGNPMSNQPVDQNYNNRDGQLFNIIPGGNSSFSRNVLESIGGFDEYYEYYHDESDLAVRIIKAGYTIHHNPMAAIYHEAASSHIRKTKFHLNWYFITKNQVYFAIKNSEGFGYSDEERIAKAKKVAELRLNDFNWLLKEKKITKDDYNEFMDMWRRGIEKGIENGFNSPRILRFDMKKDVTKFKKFDKKFFKDILNIVLLCESDIIKPMGGVPVYTNALAKYFVKLGHNVHVITNSEEETFGMIEGINIHTVKGANTGVDELELLPNCKRVLEFSYAAAKKIRQICDPFSINIIETPLWDSYGVVSTQLLNIPVCTRLETPLKMVVKTFNMEENADLIMLEDIELELMKNSNGIIYISDCIKGTIEEMYDIKINGMSVKNYLGIDMLGMAKRRRSSNDDNIEIFFIGRLERRKGIANLIEVIPDILEKYPNVIFNIAGNDEIVDDTIGTTFKNKFLKDNKRAKWLKRVVFMGMISDEDREQNLADCDIFISPSLYESFGIIFIEAMRYARPVIGCRCGGMQEVIIDEQTGLLCEPNNSESLKEKLVSLIENKELRNNLGKNGLERVKEVFSSERMAKDTVDFYYRVIENVSRVDSRY